MFPLAKTCALPRAKTVAKPHRRGINSPLTLPLMLAEQKNKIKRYEKFPRISCISFRLFCHYHFSQIIKFKFAINIPVSLSSDFLLLMV